jgi:hypothetical protein
MIPWKVTDISLRPYKGMWSMNPSVHYDGSVWRCVLRCSDYAMPGGVAIRSPRAVAGESQTKNAMVIFDPASWKPVEIYKMRERDKRPRVTCASVGYEDMRIFRTDKGGFQGIAASLHLRRDECQRHPLAEQVLLSLDAEYNVVGALPIRGGWSSSPQKNWVPFDNCAEPRFLYSIGDGALFDERGPVGSEGDLVRPSTQARAKGPEPSERARRRARERAAESESESEDTGHRRRKSDRWERGADPRVPLTCEDLRGGTQLVRVGDDGWLGIGHAMRIVDGLKYYWHVWYLVDSWGKMTSASLPMKLAPNGIEFAAGMAIAGDRVVVSFGVDDMECKIGETKLSAVLGVLQRVDAAR